jgi:predicted PurR-regulated permease PerM
MTRLDTDRFDRARLGWWLFVIALAGAMAFLTYSFIGMVVLGVFGYYATRPISDRISRVIDSDGLAAGLTVTVVLLPVLLLAIYAGIQVFHQVIDVYSGTSVGALATRIAGLDSLTAAQQTQLVSTLDNPLSALRDMQGSIWSNLQTGMTVLSGLFGAIVLLAMSITISYALLARDDGLAETLVELFGGRNTTAYAYALAVDEDLESVFFGNLVFIFVMAVIATLAYTATNFLAPEGLQVPMVLVLGLLTGFTSIIPIVVGKVVYVPVVGLLAFQATQGGGTGLPFVGGVLVVYFLVLDILPQSFIQPYITGRDFDMLVLLFAYILGPILFGWYGFFFLPIVAVLVYEAVRIVLPELVHGERLTDGPSISSGTDLDPRELRADRTDVDDSPGGSETNPDAS